MTMNSEYIKTSNENMYLRCAYCDANSSICETVCQLFDDDIDDYD